MESAKRLRIAGYGGGMAGPDAVCETVTARPGAGVTPLVERYVGYRYAGFAPGTHLGLPSRYLTVVISLGAPTRTVAMPDPRRPPATSRRSRAVCTPGPR